MRACTRWFAFLSCALLASCLSQPAEVALEVPTPPEALDVLTQQQPRGLTQITFTYSEPYPNASVRIFYEQWAAERGWEVVPESEESWTTEGWELIHFEGTRMAQSFAHWRSPDQEWSLRVAVRQGTGDDHQSAYIVYGPYHLLSDEVDSSDQPGG